MTNTISPQIYFHHINFPVSDGYLNSLQHNASQDRRMRARRYRKPEDKVRCLKADYVLKTALKIQNMMDAYDHIRINDYGKPIFDKHINGCFNLSHSGNWVACALDKKPIGIDVEQCNEQVDLSVTELFNASEQNYIDSATALNKLKRFYRIWTLKESYLKAIGLGLNQSLDSFSIEIIDEHRANLVLNNKVQNQWHLYTFFLDNNHIVGICAQRPIHANTFIYV